MNIIKIIILIIMSIPLVRLAWYIGSYSKLECEKLDKELSRDA